MNGGTRRGRAAGRPSMPPDQLRIELRKRCSRQRGRRQRGRCRGRQHRRGGWRGRRRTHLPWFYFHAAAAATEERRRTLEAVVAMRDAAEVRRCRMTR